MNIEQMIDNAVRDWETSNDAMRWTPEPAKTELTKWQADVARAFGVPTEFPSLPHPAGPTPEVIEAIGERITAAFEPLRRQFDRFAASIKGARLSFALFDEPYRQPRRSGRVTRLRGAYRHKTRNRW